jgi:hypothetical protein
MKHIFSILVCLLLVACGGHVKLIDYTPDISNVKDPISTIKTTIEQQPPAYAYVPLKVEVTNKRMTLYLYEAGIVSKLIGYHDEVPTIFYYKNLGVPKLSRSMNPPLWYVEIFDKFGNDLYWVYTEEEKEAKGFINALYYMINHQN